MLAECGDSISSENTVYFKKFNKKQQKQKNRGIGLKQIHEGNDDLAVVRA